MVADGNIPPMENGPSANSTEEPRMAPGTGDSFADATQHIADAVAYIRQYVTAQADRLKLAVRQVVLLALLGIVAAIIAATILITVSVLLCIGVADGISAALGGRHWAGDLITAFLVMGTLLVSTRFVLKGIIKSSREKTRLEYEQRRYRN